MAVCGGGRLVGMSDTITPVDHGPSRKYGATFAGAALEAGPVQIVNPTGSEHVIVEIRNADGAPVHFNPAITDSGIIVDMTDGPAAEMAAAGPYTVTIIG